MLKQKFLPQIDDTIIAMGSAFVLLLLPVLTFGQKIKIKKNKVLFDKKEVAIMEDGDERNKYTFKYFYFIINSYG